MRSKLDILRRLAIDSDWPRAAEDVSPDPEQLTLPVGGRFLKHGN
jgi:hypothetical protein